MAYKLLIVEDEKEKATGIAYLTGKYYCYGYQNA